MISIQIVTIKNNLLVKLLKNMNKIFLILGIFLIVIGSYLQFTKTVLFSAHIVDGGIPAGIVSFIIGIIFFVVGIKLKN